MFNQITKSPHQLQFAMYKRILVPLNDSSLAEITAHTAMSLAKKYEARVRFMHVADQMPVTCPQHGSADTPDNYSQIIEGTAKKFLEKFRHAANEQGVSADIAVRLGYQSRVSEYVEYEALRWRADVVVIGNHARRGIKQIVFGSETDRIARNCPTPVLLVKQSSFSRPDPGRFHSHGFFSNTAFSTTCL